MLFKFGLANLRTICNIFCGILMGGGFVLLVAAMTFRFKWQGGGHIMGRIFYNGPDLALYLSLVIIFVGFIGFMGIFTCKVRVLWLFVCLCGLLMPVLIFCGFHLYRDSFSVYSVNVILIESQMRALSPLKLDKIQKVFHCCGIEKFTDFILLWSLWGLSPDRMEKTWRTRPMLTYSSGTWMVYPQTQFVLPFPLSGRKKKDIETMTGAEKVMNMAPPNAEELDEIFGFYHDPLHIDKSTATTKGRFIEWKNWIYDKIRDVVYYFEEPISKMVRGAAKWLYSWVPGFIAQWCEACFKYIYNTFKFIRDPASSILRWWNGSGWDQLIMNDQIRVSGLPMSCCKNPSTRCYGGHADTWRDGCKLVVAEFYRRGMLEFALIILCLLPIILMTMITVHVYTEGIVENYFV